MNALSLWKELDNLSNGFWGTGCATDRAYAAPRVDAVEKKDSYQLTVELPGFSKEDLKIEVKDGVLEIASENRPTEEKAEEGTWLIRERRNLRFKRSFQLPRDVKTDAVEASFKDGLLVLTLPKAEESKPKQVPIRAA